MNILLLGHYDIASLYALDRVVRHLPTHTCKVCLSPSLMKRENAHPAMSQLADADTHLCARFMAGQLGNQSPSPNLKQYIGLGNPNLGSGLELVTSFNPDLIISIRYRRILHDACIAVPRHGVINLHSGLLPAYRGVMASFWAMLNDEASIGTTLHQIVDRGIDTGPIISRQSQRCDHHSSYLANVLSLYNSGTNAILETVSSIENLRKIQNAAKESGGEYYSEPADQHVNRFLRAGKRLVDGTEESLVTALISESHQR